MELDDIQGLLVRGHGDLASAAYIMLQITDAENARNWLRDMLEEITPADQKPENRRLQLVFTYSGMQKLGSEAFVKHGFSVAFSQGMATNYRARVLGDMGESAEKYWKWGGSNNPQIDLGLLVFSPDDTALAETLDELASVYLTSGLKDVIVLDSQMNAHHKEHFGFRDGVGQPILPGLKKTGPAENTIAIGEFVLGYHNGYQQFPETPLVAAELDQNGYLADAPNEKDKDFGKNGSYLVFRQLQQNVHGFWQQLQNSAARENPDAGPQECIHLAAKMVGRWPNGTPITLSPEGEQPELAEENNFGYAKKDPYGHGCPLGSHIRRANPRDAMPANKTKNSYKIANRHRILRRGRNFGPALSPTFRPEDLMAAAPDDHPRGLQFLCFNANISRQFEFVQHTWNNNTKFSGLYNDPDPILGIKDTRNKNATHDFTIEADPVRRKIRGLQRHVHMRGGAYFFMPGLRALRYLAHFDPSSPKSS